MCVNSLLALVPLCILLTFFQLFDVNEKRNCSSEFIHAALSKNAQKVGIFNALFKFIYKAF